MADKRCETCRYMKRTGAPFYECRRHAPIAKNETNRLGGVNQAHWPMVEGHQWCGDWAAKPDSGS